MGSGGGGSHSQTTSTQQRLPIWEQPFAKEYLASLASLIYPGMTLPSDYIGNKNYKFGQHPAGQGGSSGGGSMGPPNIQAPGLDTGLASAFLNPQLASSPYLQNQNALNPYGTAGAASPAAFNQLAALYPNLASGKKG